MPTRSATAIVAVLLAFVAGCANTGSSSGPEASGSSSATAEPTPTPTDPSTPSPTKTRGSEPGGEITVTGTVVAGVEPNCQVLQTADKAYLLIAQGAQAQALRAGAKVVVKGQVKSDMATTCMQGTPLVVTAVSPG